MYNFEEDLEKEKAQINAEILRLENSIAAAPEGTLKFLSRRNHIEYYQRLPDIPGMPERKIYIKKSNMELAKALAQKDYDKKVLNILKKKSKVLEKISFSYLREDVREIYRSLPAEKKNLVVPITLSDEEFIKQWQNKPYVHKEFAADDTSCFYTERGERVRSKSEVIIANALYHAGIPYKYECPHIIGGRVFYPDFTILDMRTRKEIIFEHFGMLDDPDYLKYFQKKMDFYILNGFLPGRDFIFTLESSTRPLDTRVVMKTIEGYLNN